MRTGVPSGIRATVTQRVGSRATRLWPRSLREQVRAVFFGAAVLGNVLVLPTVTTRHGTLQAALALVATVALSAVWIAGFRRRRFAWWSDVVELGLLGLVGLGLIEASVLLGPVYNGIFFRALYGRVRGAVLRAFAYTAVMAVLLVVHPSHDHMLQPGPLVGWLLPSLAMCTLTDRLLAMALDRREAAAARERVLAETATRLLQARSETQVHDLALDAVSSLLADRPAHSLALVVDHGDGPQVVATRPLGVAVPDPDEVVDGGPALVLPLRAGRGVPMSLYVRTSQPVRGDVRQSLDALAGQVSLSLGGVRLQEELSFRALHDSLTELPNRQQLGERLERALADGHSVAAVFVDLDDFKTVNDALGHHVGDQLLRAVAARLRSCERPGDLVGRLGGDEFAAILDNVDSVEAAAGVANRMLQALDAPFGIDGYEIAAQCSVGVALAKPGDTAEALLRNADTAMYVAKARGKGRSEVFSSGMRQAVTNEFELRDGLQTAIDQRQFVLYYQPLLNLRTRTVVAFEALVRWHHPERGLVPPGDFIPLAERTGQLHAIERIVLADACRAAASWPVGAEGRELALGVNLSPSHLQRSDVVATIRHALDEAGLDPRRLFIEVTESIDADDWGNVERALTDLRALGVRVALDDFGTGYSSLSLLAQLPVDSVKVDREFTTGAENGPLLAAVFDMADRLGFGTVAEGVERVEQHEMLIEAGCHLGQGFLYSRPVPAAEVPTLLRLLEGGLLDGTLDEEEIRRTLAG